ncbi:permease-like cell division protein FtsX [Actinophytocola algeriensis]|uniref:Cell division protein FtsX n=1 Tax=Actinophytocola algeriensis TaxID=1768010 RepID=A0A7W7Q6H0_9PSEU|nr:permease-like cell division protein FtsX [Actinophytocola algeriensis]MBB4907955.1 cell division protein FtsX [Actinophytocola algeriensis]MBE1479985.1 cell division protein FtsX [Actinophytocola algeriensis]
MDFVNATADDAMRLAARTLRDDPRVAEIGERSREQTYDRFKKLYADKPEMLEAARLEAMPASLMIRPADDVSPERLADDLRAELTTADRVDALPCVRAAPPSQ